MNITYDFYKMGTDFFLPETVMKRRVVIHGIINVSYFRSALYNYTNWYDESTINFSQV